MAINSLLIRKKSCYIAILLSLLFSNSLLANAERIGVVEQSLGRDFGVLVGDLIDHYYTIQIPAEYALTPASMPPTGSLDYWLDLLDAEYELLSESRQSKRYRLHFVFQTFYAPLDVRALTIPPLAVSFKAGERTDQLTIPSWTFTMSPLKEITPRGVASNSTQTAFMQPDMPPQTINTGTLQQRLWFLAGLLLVLTFLWVMIKGYLFSFSRPQFQLSLKQVKRLQKQHKHHPENFHQALQTVHRAFNAVAKQALFAHQIDTFIAKHPEFAAYQQQIVAFFQLSAETLYSEQKVATDEEFNQLQRLCKQLAGAEKLALKAS